MPNTMRKRTTAILLTLIAIIVVLGAGYTWFALNWSYAEGERAGYLQKFSKVGWLCKTWEGEMLLSSMPGAIPERFAFTVRDESVVPSLQASMGKRVQVTYDQHKGVPTSCFGETEFFVSKVAGGPDNPLSPSQAPGIVETAPAAAPVAAPAQPAAAQ